MPNDPRSNGRKFSILTGKAAGLWIELFLEKVFIFHNYFKTGVLNNLVQHRLKFFEIGKIIKGQTKSMGIAFKIFGGD